ncbi:MAG: pilus assembly protein PilM [Candidatus Omnitrophica bacterium]|nr:pilus assembly protein PilM [Candidatus Omnitrophota bacterium]
MARKQFSSVKRSLCVLQIAPDALKAIKVLVRKDQTREFISAAVEPVSGDVKDAALSEKVAALLKRIEFSNSQIVVSLPRQHVTCRYLKVPAQSPSEIEKIIQLQASKYLPYPAEELVPGYQRLFVDRDGYAHLNLIIVQKEIINRLRSLLEKAGVRDVPIIISSAGLRTIHAKLFSTGAETVMALEIDHATVEVAILSKGNLIFSRSLRLTTAETIIDEIRKTKDAYLKETAGQEPKEMLLFGPARDLQKYREVLTSALSIPVQAIGYPSQLALSESFRRTIDESVYSLVSLMGLALEKADDSLNLIPPAFKKEAYHRDRRAAQRKDIFLWAGVFFLFGVGAFKHLNNMETELTAMTRELARVSQEAKPLEVMAKKLQIINKDDASKLSSLDMFSALYQAIPPSVSLLSFSSEEGLQVVIRGQSPELAAIFAFAAQLEKTYALADFNFAVRYATKKKTTVGEVIDFEIVGAGR